MGRIAGENGKGLPIKPKNVVETAREGGQMSVIFEFGRLFRPYGMT